MKLNNWQAFNYYSWLYDTTKIEMFERLKTNAYAIKNSLKDPDTSIDEKFIKKFGKDYLTPEPDSPVGKLALWIYGHDMNWSSFGRTLNSVSGIRFKNMKWKGFTSISEKFSAEIEEVTEGFIRKEEWVL